MSDKIAEDNFKQLKANLKYMSGLYSGITQGNLDAARLAIQVLQDELQTIQTEREQLIDGLREIDTHIRSTSDPIPYIVETLKRILPEYKRG